MRRVDEYWLNDNAPGVPLLGGTAAIAFYGFPIPFILRDMGSIFAPAAELIIVSACMIGVVTAFLAPFLAKR